MSASTRRWGSALTGGFDPVTLSVLLGRFDNIVHEMSITLERTAWTTIIAVCRDFSCAVYDAVPRQVSMLDAVPIHTTSMHLVLEEIGARFRGDINDGDVFISNDPHSGNTHIGDLVAACPVFVDGVHAFWSVAKCHQLDIGALAPSSVVPSAQNVWQEGITIPPLKLVSGGVIRDELVGLYLANVRYPDLAEGDLHAQLASVEKGRQRLVEVCAEYGRDEIVAYVDRMIDYADRRMSAAIEAIPDGVYTGEGWVDSDGFELVNIRVAVTVTIKGDMVHVDMTGSAPQVRGGLNASYAVACAAAAVPFLFYIDSDIPHNHGCIKHITVEAPEGTICNARYPASTSVATCTPADAIQDAIHKAMTAAVPGRVPAGGTKDSNVPQFAGRDSASGHGWGAMVFNGSGGGGAVLGVDGWPIWESISSAGAIRIEQVEQLELRYPLRIEHAEIEPDSMGLGQWIGGPGTRLVVRPLGAEVTECITYSDGMMNPPHGALGGTMGCGGGAYIEEASRRRRYVSSCGFVRIAPGEIWVGVSTGGGGYGSPGERPVETVRRDVRDGILTRSAAAESFGVVLSDEYDPVVDVQRTEERQAALAAVCTPVIDPTTPGASRWLEDNIAAGDVYLLNPT